MVSFELSGGTAAATEFIKTAEQIPFCPSLGELSTTLSHPESTSHRSLTAAERGAIGITGGTIRLSVGIESEEAVVAAIRQALAGIE
jgi:cystathionine beta-lyase/cystathionine gamma-synthase